MCGSAAGVGRGTERCDQWGGEEFVIVQLVWGVALRDVVSGEVRNVW